MYAAGITDKGLARSLNQDFIFVSADAVGLLPNLFIVADGMGGHKAGEVASSKSVNFVVEYIRNQQMDEPLLSSGYLNLLIAAIHDANDQIFAMSETDPDMQGMGTTFTACVVTDTSLFIAHVGDSRVYSITQNSVTQLTADHTVIEQLLQAGEITTEEALTHPQRHFITRVLGEKTPFEVDANVVSLADTTAVLLCSDGLTNMISNDIILEIINRPGFVEHRTQVLIDEANIQGGQDNISAILIDIKR